MFETPRRKNNAEENPCQPAFLQSFADTAFAGDTAVFVTCSILCCGKVISITASVAAAAACLCFAP